MTEIEELRKELYLLAARVTELENKSKRKTVKLEPAEWRTNFSVYKKDLDIVFKTLSLDPKFISEQERYHPNVDIRLSMEKAVVNFWGTEAGWKFKKKSRSNDIDWKLTLINAIGMNKVYKQNGNKTGMVY
jgi:hypothetical protein